MSNETRNHKDNVFCMLYREKKNLLSLYNAMNGTSYGNEGELEVVTLDGAFCMKMKNDAAFVINSGMNLYEQQASVNPNMPLRDLYYVVEELKKIAPPGGLHRTSKVPIPAPRFVVFYNGVKPQPERQEYRLSDLFEKKEEEPELELRVTVLNINRGCNEELLRQCESLRGYMGFVGKVRDKRAAGMELKRAVSEAVSECITGGILAEFFKEHKEEIVEMGIYEFDQEIYDQVLREDGEAIGIKKGEAIGIKKGEAIGIKKGEVIGIKKGESRKLVELMCKKMKSGQSLEKIAEDLMEEVSAIEPIYKIVEMSAPEYDPEKMLERLYTGSDRNDAMK